MSKNNGHHGNPKFALGQIIGTPAALQSLAESGQSPQEFLQRHASCDWGDLCVEDAELNDEAITDGSRVLSSYHTSKGEKLWVITEAADDSGQRAATTILLPSDY